MSIYIGLLLTVMILIVNGAILPSTIEQDAETVTKLWDKFIHVLPPVGVKSYENHCRAVKDCCPKEQQENIYQLYYEGSLDKECIVSEKEQSASCSSSLGELNKLQHDLIYSKYAAALYPSGGDLQASHDATKKWGEQMKKLCSKDEVNAFFCQRRNMKKFKSCQRKVLQSVAQESIADDKVYTKYVSQLKDNITSNTENLVKAFPKLS